MTTIQRRKLIRHLRATLRKFGKAAEAARFARHEEGNAVHAIGRAARNLRDSHAADGAPAAFATSIALAASYIDTSAIDTRESNLLAIAEILGALR